MTFAFGCSILPFNAIEYSILARHGNHLCQLLDGIATPRDEIERYFIRCIRENVDYDSHQSLEAEAWRKWQERLSFEKKHPSPTPNRSWIRADELRGGMILLLESGAVLYETQVPEVRGQLDTLEFRSHASFAWRSSYADPGKWRCVTPFETGVLEEKYIHQDEKFVVYDPPQDMMTLMWWGGTGEEMLIAKPQTRQTYYIEPQRISHDVSSAGKLEPEMAIRVQSWHGEPFWIWGPA